MTKFCSQCGAPISNDALFCEECGNKITKPLSSEINERIPHKSEITNNGKIEKIRSNQPFSLIHHHRRILSIIGIILLVISMFIPSSVSFFIGLDPDGFDVMIDNQVHKVKVGINLDSTFDSINKYIMDPDIGSNEGMYGVFILIGAISLASIGVIINSYRYVCIAGIGSLVYYLILFYNFDFLSNMYSLLIIAAIIISIIGYIKNDYRLHTISVILVILNWVLGYRSIVTEYKIFIVWIVIFIIALLCLLIPGAIYIEQSRPSEEL